MSTVSKKNYKIISILACSALLMAAVFVAFGITHKSAKADSVGVAALTPISVNGGDVTYKCFDAPNSVFADSAGIIVAGENSIEYISGESEVTATRKIAADKAYRHLEHGEHTEYLIMLRDGGITLYAGEQDGIPMRYDGASVTGIVDFAVDGDTLYAATADKLYTVQLGETEFGDATLTALHSTRHKAISVKAVVAVDGIAYVVIGSSFGNRNDICTVGETGALSVALMQADTVLSITAVHGTVYVLTRSDITSYSIASNNGLIRQNAADGSILTNIYAFGGSVYALDSLNALHKLSGNLAYDVVLFASSSDAVGYFNTPSGVAVKHSTMYVADTLNNRIAVYGNTVEYVEREFISPVSVACDSAGTIYVAYEYNKIGIFRDGNFAYANEQFVLENKFGTILQIAVNAEKTLYVLTDNGLWALYSDKTAPEKISDVCFRAITLGIGRDALYGLDGDKIYEIGETTNVKYTAGADVLAFAVDLDGSAIMLTDKSVRTYRTVNGSPITQDYSLTLDGEQYALGGKLGQITLSTVANNFVSHGDVIITDGDKHRLFKTDGKTLGIKLIDESYEVPILADSNIPEYYGDGLIRTTVRATEVFALPMEAASIYTIARGRNVIVPQYDLDDAHEYSLVLVDDTVNGKLVQGYVYKDALSDAIAYSAPPAEVCTVYNGATPLYKFPSRHSKVLYGYAAVDSNVKLDMLNFVADYRDDYGYIWYRVSLGQNTEGYVISINVSTTSTEPVMLRPAYNADIISYKGSAAAPGYIRSENGEYTQVTELATGTRVEVVGAFDSSKQYNEIKYFDPDKGTLTCFVETVYVKYNGVNIVLLVAIIVIMITVIFATIIVARVVHNKKKNIEGGELDKPDEEQPKTEETEKK